jgi:hypothetical protein
MKTLARGSWTIVAATVVLACGSSSPKPGPPPPAKPVAKASASAPEEPLPAYLQHFPGLFVRKGAEIVDAPPADIEVAKTYPRSKEKGPVIDGHRITLLSKKRTYRVGEEVRVLHFHEINVEGEQVYPMGPKPIRGEYVNGKLVTPSVLVDADPFIPQEYDGAVIPSPAVDYNWEITSYRFSAPGTRAIQWKLGKFASNILTIEVTQ